MLTCLLVPWALSLSGCGFWDDFRAVGYSPNKYFNPPDPVQVLASGTTDGNARARAIVRLKEPALNGGSERDQEYVVLLLTKAAKEDPQMWCRLKSIEKLGEFKDPRATTALIDAYYAAENFAPDNRKVLREQSLEALGKVGDRDPQAVDLLVRVVSAPPVDAGKSSEEDKQMYLDERIAAARALSNCKNYRATEALVQVLRSEKDVALRDRAHDALVASTGKKLPPDPSAWENLLNDPNAPQPNRGIAGGAKILQPIVRTSATEKK
jgi:HEAT repeat protein